MGSSRSTDGRLVWNHSTHIPGLIPILERLTKQRGIQTITPGVISSVRSRAQQLRLKISVPIRGGFKLIARKGKTAQEVFILTSLAQHELEGAIAQVMGSAKK
ncbi:MAG: metal-binding protein [Cyanothece sp. SIO1E1]|nr:metal-binding protein [Cyanothece sp. SIO1E1]